MKWDYISATGFCESVRDGTHDTPKPVEKGYKLVTGKHIRDGIIDPDDAYYISEIDFKKINERSRVNQWDVLMSMIGNGLGRSAVVRDEPDYAIKNIALFKVGNEIKAKWLHYYLAGPDGQGLIYASLQGSGQPFISLSYLRDFPIPNPPMNVMEKIVSIAEKYDELIDKNRKQIKLLEEAAQRLYKEWFVDLRFPGHEEVDIVDGLPDGWIIRSVGDLCVKSRNTVNPEDIPLGTPYIGLEHIPRHDFCLSEWGDASEISSSKARYKKNDIIFGQIRPYFHKVGFALTDGVASTDSFIMTPYKEVWGLFLLTVFSDAFVNYSYQTCKEGAKMPRADWNQMSKYPIRVPGVRTKSWTL